MNVLVADTKASIIESISLLNPTTSVSALKRMRKEDLKSLLVSIQVEEEPTIEELIERTPPVEVSAPGRKPLSAEARKNLRETMNLGDRAIIRLDDEMVWGTAYKAFKEGEITGHECDKVTRVLMAAEKAGKVEKVVLKSGTYMLEKNF